MKGLKQLKCTKTSLFYPSTSKILHPEHGSKDGSSFTHTSCCHPEMKHGARNMLGNLGLKMALKKNPKSTFYFSEIMQFPSQNMNYSQLLTILAKPPQASL